MKWKSIIFIPSIVIITYEDNSKKELLWFRFMAYQNTKKLMDWMKTQQTEVKISQSMDGEIFITAVVHNLTGEDIPDFITKD